ncbi:MAG: type II toxin-antitoxin system PemK/MazF family toxin [Treponema sp.]|nr:type II toxin-antitoxin system PemK/MazF family toxin [Treponema sp.]
MMNGEIWWVDFQEPRGSTPAFIRPGIIIQNDELNSSELNSTIVIPLTTNCRLADYKGNVFFNKSDSKLPKDSVALCSQITTVDKQALLEKNSRLSTELLNEVYEEISWVLEN